MSKKSFIEEELAREARLRKKQSNKPTPSQINRRKEFETALMVNKYGLILTPNEVRAQYEYPTITDAPQSAGIVVTHKLRGIDGNENEVPLFFYE